MTASATWIRDRLSEGDRRVPAAASSVADAVIDDPDLVEPLLECLGDSDPAVVSHAAHAAMQVSARQPSLFDAHIEDLMALLKALNQWEIGEQLPKILVCLPLSREQSGRLLDILKAQFPKCMHGLLIAAARQARGDALPTMPMRWNHRR